MLCENVLGTLNFEGILGWNWKKMDAWKFERKPLVITLCWRQADKIDVTRELSFGENVDS